MACCQWDELVMSAGIRMLVSGIATLHSCSATSTLYTSFAVSSLSMLFSRSPHLLNRRRDDITPWLNRLVCYNSSLSFPSIAEMANSILLAKVFISFYLLSAYAFLFSSPPLLATLSWWDMVCVLIISFIGLTTLTDNFSASCCTPLLTYSSKSLSVVCCA